MEYNKNHPPAAHIISRSLPNILISSQLDKQSLLHRSHSLTFCLKSFQGKSDDCKRVPNSNKQTIDKRKKSDPTIGELLGDDDLFHYRHYHQYSTSRFQRKRYRYRSDSRSAHNHIRQNRRKQQRSNYFDPPKESQYPVSASNVIESIPDTNAFYLYPTTYSYPSVPAYCYYCYSNMASCCPYLISDCYTGLYNQEISYEPSTFSHT